MKDPITDPNVVGYVGVAIFARQFYQGFMVDRRMEDGYRRMLADVREQMRKARLMNKFAGMSIPEVVRPATVGEPQTEEDAQLTAALSATLVEVCILGTQRQGMVMHAGMLCGALRMHLKQDFFWIDGKAEQGGTTTTVIPLAGTTPAQAREAFRHQPAIMMIDAMRSLKKP